MNSVLSVELTIGQNQVRFIILLTWYLTKNSIYATLG